MPKFVFEAENKQQISDGYHTFEELYHHRMVLFSVICNQNKDKAWKSWKHDDGSMYKDYFIVGINTPLGQYTYHYHKDYWEAFRVQELEAAPKYDGHKPEDVTRLLYLIGDNKLKTCDYCGDDVEKVRPTPFMADVPAEMCKDCWNVTKEEYEPLEGVNIGEFDDYPHFEKDSKK